MQSFKEIKNVFNSFDCMIFDENYSPTKYTTYLFKGALNPNFLNFTKNRDKFCL